MLSRRGFLKALAGVLAAPIVARLPQAPPGPRPEPPPPKPGPKSIAEMIATPEGRAKLAASVTQHLRAQRDHVGIGRKVFAVEPLPPPDSRFYIATLSTDYLELPNGKVFTR